MKFPKSNMLFYFSFSVARSDLFDEISALAREIKQQTRPKQNWFAWECSPNKIRNSKKRRVVANFGIFFSSSQHVSDTVHRYFFWWIFISKKTFFSKPIQLIRYRNQSTETGRKNGQFRFSKWNGKHFNIEFPANICYANSISWLVESLPLIPISFALSANENHLSHLKTKS